ncbi:hypothetical protein T484DRAFT_1905636 [Baffinella frigidus]|nr:hypothetical protein T484DRAFT_1905636 [Cryptophyta sp. CCMP2293]|mmetsp:Transcript_52784/g.125648  ORF Transcript_52784/g.125648 Transcript_52784/m.125648 type:complete len:141 (+) Transcript_52784:165-587(+)
MAEGGVAAMSLAEDSGAQAGRCAAIQEHTFQETVLDVAVCVQILAMKGSYIIWVGTKRPTFQALDLAMMTPMDPVPVGSTLMGDSADSPGPSLAKRVAMKTKAQVYLSYNLPSTMPALQAGVEQLLMREIKAIQAAAASA